MHDPTLRVALGLALVCSAFTGAASARGQEIRRLPEIDQGTRISLVFTIARWRDKAKQPPKDLQRITLRELEQSEELVSLTRIKLVTTSGEAVESDTQERVYYVAAVDRQGRETRKFVRVGTVAKARPRLRDGKIESEISVRTARIIPGDEGQLVGRTPQGKPLRAPARGENGVDTSVTLEDGQSITLGATIDEDSAGSGGVLFWLTASILR